MLPRKLDRASTSPSTVVTVKSGAAWPTFDPTLSDRVEVGSGTGVPVGTGVGDDGTGVAGVGVLAVVSPGSSVPWVGFDCIELSGVESPPTEGTGVSVVGEIIAGPETVGSVSSVQPVATLAARNTPSRQVETSRQDFRYMVMLVPLSAPFKGQCGMSHENHAAGRVASGPLIASAAKVYSAPGSVSTATPRTRAGSRRSSPGPRPHAAARPVLGGGQLHRASCHRHPPFRVVRANQRPAPVNLGTTLVVSSLRRFVSSSSRLSQLSLSTHSNSLIRVIRSSRNVRRNGSSWWAHISNTETLKVLSLV